MREQPKITEEALRTCLQALYGIDSIAFEFLPIGLDYQAGVYRVESRQGIPYFLKVTSRPLYDPSCLVPRYLKDQGITSVVAPLPSREDTLWARIKDWTIIVYPFIEGNTSWTGMTDEQWRQVGTIFRSIHQVVLPTLGFEDVRRETFDVMLYARWVDSFEAQHMQEGKEDSATKRELRSSWLAHRSTIHIIVSTMEKLAPVLLSQTLPYVICHADLHPANLLRDRQGHVFVIDWDEVMLAPKERDFLFVKESTTDSEALPGTPAFFQGYGQTTIDWTALAYYRCERIIQDLLACAQEVFFRDDLGEDTKMDSLQLFRSTLAEGGEIEATTQAFTHLPSELALPSKMISGIEKELAGRENLGTL